MSVQPIEHIDLGLISYQDALHKQQHWHEQVLADDRLGGVVLSLEHPPVITFGKHAAAEHLIASPEMLVQQGVDLHHTDRGGEVTGHEPGQLVVYPILSIQRLGLTPRKYVCLLEKSVIKLLAGYGIEARTDAEHPGVWVRDEKICAVGIRIKDRVTMHGIALNVTNDLSVFRAMVPCGIQGKGVCNLASLTDQPVDMDTVKTNFFNIFAGALAVDRK